MIYYDYITYKILTAIRDIRTFTLSHVLILKMVLSFISCI